MRESGVALHGLRLIARRDLASPVATFRRPGGANAEMQKKGVRCTAYELSPERTEHPGIPLRLFPRKAVTRGGLKRAWEKQSDQDIADFSDSEKNFARNAESGYSLRARRIVSPEMLTRSVVTHIKPRFLAQFRGMVRIKDSADDSPS